jgi:hypothetical protein
LGEFDSEAMEERPEGTEENKAKTKLEQQFEKQ